MIITCASCLTKFNLDDSKISSKGANVRCSRCQHVFFIVPPPATKKEVEEDFGSFAKYHKELFQPGEKEEKGGAEEESFESFAKYHKELFQPEAKEEVKQEVKQEEKEEEFPEFRSPIEFEKESIATKEGQEEKGVEDEEESFLFSEKASTDKAVKVSPRVKEESKAKIKTRESKQEKGLVQKERRRPSLFFIIIVAFLILVVFGALYMWKEVGSVGQISYYFEYTKGKVTHLWKQVWGTEKRGLTIGDLMGYEEQIGEFPLFIIQGKVNNQSAFTKKHIKVNVAIFDQNKVKVAEKETICGRIISREEMEALPADFFVGEIVIGPKAEKEMIVPSGKTTPFMVIFKYLSNQAKEFTVEIVEAPNL